MAQRRRVFTKLLKDEKAVMQDLHQARRFLEGMETFESKPDLLTQLTDNRNQGLRRVEQLMSFCDSIANVETCLIGLLKHILTEETSRPMYRGDKSKILMTIFRAPRLIDFLVGIDAVRNLRQESADYLCQFLLHTSKAIGEARMSNGVKEMAKALRGRGDVEQAHMLCVFLMVDGALTIETEENSKNIISVGRKKTAPCWITDETPPGGRHDNDHLNFRNIQVVPTANELCCEKSSWLPLASGENAYIADRQTRLLDSNFRLLREDAIRVMKANIAEEDDRFRWRNARVIDLHIESPRKGRAEVSFLVQCDSRAKGNPNWDRSRALSHGSVVAFCQGATPKMLGVIVARDAETPGKGLNTIAGPIIGVRFEESSFQQALDDMNLNCSHNESVAKLESQLIEAMKGGKKSEPALKDKKNRIQQLKDHLTTYIMVEASSSFFSYQPVLKALQSMSSIPFTEEICSETSDRIQSILPDYLPQNLQMKLPTNGGHKLLSISKEPWPIEEIVRNTTLDSTQADAINHAFTNRVALIQGPPGTGKTFIGALVAQAVRQNTDETILCICYTNHALDQFLEHLMDAGERRIVRIGGRSRSEKMEQFQLRELARSKASLAREDGRRIKRVDAQLYELHATIIEKFETTKKHIGWKQPSGGIKALLEDYYPDYYRCMILPDQIDGFRIMGSYNKALKDDYLWKCWIEGQPFPDFLRFYLPARGLPSCFEGFWGSPLAERFNMRDGWRHEILGDRIDNVRTLIKTFNDLIADRQAIHQEKDLQILKQARVIGVTTTGAAQYKDLLALTGPGVIIIEEAGEVLEAHVVSALQADASKHLILIGDHQQLRPKVESYELTTVSGVGYDLDRSLFERLVMSGLASVSLGVQHRMRPEISAFVRRQTYPKLSDHPSVLNFPDVKGVSENLAFLDHSFPEDGAEHCDDAGAMRTKSNYAEAELCVAVVRFLLLQGYSADKVVILTPYLGQLFKIIQLVDRRLKEATAFVSENDLLDLDRMKDDPGEAAQQPRKRGSKSVRCSSIDNFQGEEADIIVISLVRSNESGNIGFLKEEQRVNVLMSRARHGLYVIGNAQTLRLSSQGRFVWNPILKGFENSNRLLKGLPTVCQLHTEDGTLVLSTLKDFQILRPNGGCTRPCSFRMECGHACTLMCHPYDREHTFVQGDCCETCRRVPPECHLSHQCTRLCKDDCGPCQVVVEDVRLNCGHLRTNAKCHDIRDGKAIVQLTKTCRQIVKHDFPCGHELDTICSNARSEKPKCPGKCNCVVEGCNHPCTNNCGECEVDDGQRHHCGKTCERKLFCGHACDRPCHVGNDCPPCKRPCFRSCSHSACPKKCYQPCSSCVEDCDWICCHQGRCPLVCGAPCLRLPCNKRCRKHLSCGHQCPSLCGEPCPEKIYCQECCSENRKETVVDIVCFATYKNHDVDEDPVIVLPCGHFYATSTLDGHLSLDEVYEKQDEAFVATKPLSDTVRTEEKPIVCPDCRSVIHSVRRYGRILHFSELRSLERKHIMSNEQTLTFLANECSKSNKNSKHLADKLENLEQKLLKSPMSRVYEACVDRNSFDIPKPPIRLLLKTLGLLGEEYSNLSSVKDDDNDALARMTLDRAIKMADESISIRSCAMLRLHLCRHMVKLESATISEPVKKKVLALLQAVIMLDEKFPELASKAREMKESLQNSREELALVLRAAADSGYNYGTSWSSHWYECPNGHPYFIGNCGGARDEARCIECGSAIGGTGHRLNPTNRMVGGIFREILAGNTQG